MEFLRKNRNLLSLLIFIAGFSLIVIGVTTKKSSIISQNNTFLKSQIYNGSVVNKFVDSNRHNRSFIVLDNYREISVNDKIYESVILKDSIVKKQGDFFITVYRGAYSFNLNLN